VKVRVWLLPVPLRGTLCGLAAASSVIVRLALRLPRAVGVKVTEIVQEAAAAKVAGQVAVWAKWAESAPVRSMLLIARGADPLLVRVTVWVLVVPTR
jgi:hypothetical protein